jgi:hypothetical protein
MIVWSKGHVPQVKGACMNCPSASHSIASAQRHVVFSSGVSIQWPVLIARRLEKEGDGQMTWSWQGIAGPESEGQIVMSCWEMSW